MNNEARFKDALARLASDKPMLSGKGKGAGTEEYRTRILYANRVLSTSNRNDAIESGVIAEMQSQSSTQPAVTETLLGEHPLQQGPQDKDQ